MTVRAAAAALLALALLTACSPDAEEPEPSPPATATASATSSAAPSPSEPAPMEDVAGQGATHATPVWDDAAKAAAQARAVEFMTGFARPDLPADQWLAGIQPLMAPEARETYAAVNPAQVPASALTGASLVQDGPSPYVATVVVATNAGDYTVTLSRTADGEPWLVQYADPAGG
ncbi:hypothetical protein FE374_15100 [Georgenia yuyongxinii]|uniref:Lipoprotein n=1 Tax=Georgenia yuyongxinii TaxID=2589797 RepID=A0A5B8C8G3_9MICO|nr:hypothetical protein [Georgenia yuyongxinii]QDC25761.1 hypothetical protein FE374_15100 [Georgenia yuyongxinii]